MAQNDERYAQLLEKLDALLRRQDAFSTEIAALKREISELSETRSRPPEVPLKTATTPPPAPERPPVFVQIPSNRPPQRKSDLEKFIGENLINKIGIAITVIGVGIGAKYAIDHQMINPLTRVIIGYFVGATLMLFAVRLKKNFQNFSAVLLGGSMAILYFITFSAYSFYGLIPQVPAFLLMLAFTAFTVIAAINYNMQVIAHFGLVGAYAVPFLLSDGSGRVGVLFSYTAIINAGILAISFRKYWKPLLYSSFVFTWLIYFSWYATLYETAEHFGLGLVFLFVFFGIFYAAFLAYKLAQKENFVITDIALLLSNSFIFYGIGYSMLNEHAIGAQLLGLFTVANGLIHFVVALVIYRQQLADRNLFYFIAGLVLVFITIAVPVQLDGNWVTLLWVGEAALLFWIGRTKNVNIYEALSYPLMALAVISIFHDWEHVYSAYDPASPDTRVVPLLNVTFLSAVLFAAAFSFINYLDRSVKYPETILKRAGLQQAVSLILPAILVLVVYMAFRVEITVYWDQLYSDSRIVSAANDQQGEIPYNQDLPRFRDIWILNYSLAFLAGLALLNLRKWRNQQLGFASLALSTIAVVITVVSGLWTLSQLRESYLSPTPGDYHLRGIKYIGIRYVTLLLVAATLTIYHRLVREDFMKMDFKMGFDLFLHVVVVWLASSELIHWLEIGGSAESHRLGLSILWGLYSLFLIILGIWKKKKYLRLAAIAWFGITLIKLFFYDISDLGTIAKTIVFVSLGVLLLISSFLYNKYKNLIADEVRT